MQIEEYYNTIKTRFPSRFSKKEKLAFFNFLQEHFDNITLKKANSSSNIVIGDLAKSQIILTAHYDTAKKNPINAKMYFDNAHRNNFKRYPLFMLNSVACFKKNINNDNDNTSGILAVLDILSKNTQIPAILFDNEEHGYMGSYAMPRKYKSLRDKIFINLDCIGVGEDFVIIYNKPMKGFANVLKHFFAMDIDCQRENQARYYSDSSALKNAVTVTCFKKDTAGKRYIDDIHTKHDNKINLQNIYAVSSAISEFLSPPNI